MDEPNSRRVYDDVVVGRITQGDPLSYRAAAAAINASPADVVCVQHEFGLYGVHGDGAFEDHLLPLLEELRRPVVTTLHTVLPQPEPWMRDDVRAIARASAETVVMVDTAARLLRESYGITRPVSVIPHGMPAVDAFGSYRTKKELGIGGRTVISTFGLVDSRKGLEYAIEAMPAVATRHPDVLYLVIGQTHPELLRKEGERYREMLGLLVARLGLNEHVAFVNAYVPQRDVVDYLVATDVYVTPYLDPNQITSGTLAYAMGTGKAIVSTPYLHAREALADGRGVLVGFRRPDEIANAVNAILEGPERRARLERAASKYSAGTAWPAVGARVLALLRKVLAARAAASRAA